MEPIAMPLIILAVGILFFLVGGGPQECVKAFANGRIKVAEANARTEEAKLERARLERDADKQL